MNIRSKVIHFTQHLWNLLISLFDSKHSYDSRLKAKTLFPHYFHKIQEKLNFHLRSLSLSETRWRNCVKNVLNHALKSLSRKFLTKCTRVMLQRKFTVKIIFQTYQYHLIFSTADCNIKFFRKFITQVSKLKKKWIKTFMFSFRWYCIVQCYIFNNITVKALYYWQL